MHLDLKIFLNYFMKITKIQHKTKILSQSSRKTHKSLKRKLIKNKMYNYQLIAMASKRNNNKHNSQYKNVNIDFRI